MTEGSETSSPAGDDHLEQARRDKLHRWRDEYGVEPYGRRVDGLIPLAEARSRFDKDAHEAFTLSKEQAKADPAAPITDDRPRVRGKGSAIFVHLARPGYTPTEGCIAFSRADLLAVLAVLRRGTTFLVTR